MNNEMNTGKIDFTVELDPLIPLTLEYLDYQINSLEYLTNSFSRNKDTLFKEKHLNTLTDRMTNKIAERSIFLRTILSQLLTSDKMVQIDMGTLSYFLDYRKSIIRIFSVEKSGENNENS